MLSYGNIDMQTAESISSMSECAERLVTVSPPRWLGWPAEYMRGQPSRVARRECVVYGPRCPGSELENAASQAMRRCGGCLSGHTKEPQRELLKVIRTGAASIGLCY